MKKSLMLATVAICVAGPAFAGPWDVSGARNPYIARGQSVEQGMSPWYNQAPVTVADEKMTKKSKHKRHHKKKKKMKKMEEKKAM